MEEKQEQARKLYEDSGGKMPLKEIAAQLGVSEGTVRSWKNRKKWGQNDCNVAALRTNATQREKQRKNKERSSRKVAKEITKNSKLDEREREFILYAVDAGSAGQAAMRTGRYGSKASARTAGCEMMKNPAVKAEIERLKELKRASMLVSLDDLVEYHMRVAMADMSDYVSWGQEEVMVMGPYGPIEIEAGEDPETGIKIKKPLTKVVNTVRFKEYDQVDGQMIEQVKLGRDGASIKLVSRQESLDFLDRFFEANPMDRHKKEYDKKRYELEERGVKVQEDKLHGVTQDVETIKAGLRDLIGIINTPVPDRGLEDE